MLDENEEQFDPISIPRERVGFLEAAAGLLLAPRETTEILFLTRTPPYGWTLFFCLLLSIYVPIGAQMFKYGYAATDTGVVISITLLIFFGLLLFLMVEGIFLQILKVNFNMQMLFSCIAYALTPLMLCLWLIYTFNYMSSGRLTLVTYLLTGFGSIEDSFLTIIPYSSAISLIWVLVVFNYCINSMAQTSQVVSLLVTVVSLVPFILSLIVALFVGEMVHPGTTGIVFSLLHIPFFSPSY